MAPCPKGSPGRSLTGDSSARTLARDVADRIQEDNAPVEPVARPEAEAALLGPRIGAMVYHRLDRARAGR